MFGIRFFSMPAARSILLCRVCGPTPMSFIFPEDILQLSDHQCSASLQDQRHSLNRHILFTKEGYKLKGIPFA